MYSFQPLVDATANDHFLFYTWCVLMVVAIAILVYSLESVISFALWLIVIGVTVYTGYSASFAPEKIYANEKVTATLVGFQPEGYNEKSGKSRADKHYMYVVYEVNGHQVILNAQTGVDYPKTAVLYKN